MSAPYSAPDLAARILSGKRGNELRRLGGHGLEADRIILSELRYIAADLSLRGETAAEQHGNHKLAIRIRSSRDFAAVTARVRAAIREEQQHQRPTP